MGIGAHFKLGMAVAGLAFTLVPASRPVPVSAGTTSTYSSIAGGWSSHGFDMSIAADGQAVAHWRVYQWCTDLTNPAPCDSIIGNQIEAGGLGMLRFTSTSGSDATAMVLMSSDPGTLTTGGQVSLQLLPGGIARMRGVGSSAMLICGPNYDAAQFNSPPCGA
jgi:hypothetical protein